MRDAVLAAARAVRRGLDDRSSEVVCDLLLATDAIAFVGYPDEQAALLAMSRAEQRATILNILNEEK
jgi:hypothetical protein